MCIELRAWDSKKWFVDKHFACVLASCEALAFMPASIVPNEGRGQIFSACILESISGSKQGLARA